MKTLPLFLMLLLHLSCAKTPQPPPLTNVQIDQRLNNFWIKNVRQTMAKTGAMVVDEKKELIQKMQQLKQKAYRSKDIRRQHKLLNEIEALMLTAIEADDTHTATEMRKVRRKREKECVTVITQAQLRVKSGEDKKKVYEASAQKIIRLNRWDKGIPLGLDQKYLPKLRNALDIN